MVRPGTKSLNLRLKQCVCALRRWSNHWLVLDVSGLLRTGYQSSSDVNTHTSSAACSTRSSSPGQTTMGRPWLHGHSGPPHNNGLQPQGLVLLSMGRPGWLHVWLLVPSNISMPQKNLVWSTHALIVEVVTPIDGPGSSFLLEDHSAKRKNNKKTWTGSCPCM